MAIIEAAIETPIFSCAVCSSHEKSCDVGEIREWYEDRFFNTESLCDVSGERITMFSRSITAEDVFGAANGTILPKHKKER